MKYAAKTVYAAICPQCGAEIPRGAEFCPYCDSVLVSYCTFCGADLPLEATECPECGLNTSGIVCPKCGAISHRSFCPNCNEPLTTPAKKAVKKTCSDPLFQRIKELAAKAMKQNQTDSNQTRQLINEINGLLSSMSPPSGATPQEQRLFYSARKVEILNTEQADGQKKEAHVIKAGWICNLCGCCHASPSECAMPELGGRWVFRMSDGSQLDETTND